MYNIYIMYIYIYYIKYVHVHIQYGLISTIVKWWKYHEMLIMNPHSCDSLKDAAYEGSLSSCFRDCHCL